MGLPHIPPSTPAPQGIGRNGLHHRGSLHDARLLRMTVAVGAIERVLRGAWHDRDYRLAYQGVCDWSLQVPRPTDDLLVHEVRWEDGWVVHELLFSGDRVVAITCATLTFTEHPGTNGTAR